MYTTMEKLLEAVFSMRSAPVVEVEVTLRPTVIRLVSLGVRRPSGTCDQFYFHHEIFFRQMLFCNFVAPSLTKERVCNLLVQLFRGLARTVTLGSEAPQNSRPYFTVSSETPPAWRARFPYLYPPGTRWPSARRYNWATR
jgi:hypothetical protein